MIFLLIRIKALGEVFGRAAAKSMRRAAFAPDDSTTKPEGKKGLIDSFVL
jgi:hypothetical protein